MWQELFDETLRPEQELSRGRERPECAGKGLNLHRVVPSES